MVDVATELKLRYWPSPQDYNEAVQNLGSNARDPELRGSTIETTSLGLPRPLTGAFASVYRVRSGGKDMAVRCFLRDMAEQKQRYHLISDFVQHDELPYTVGFDFVSEGIRVGGNWYPVLKMDWVDGLNLDMYVAKHLGTPKIEELANKFKQMCFDLRDAGIAHGDLQHGNIIICDDEIRLVDYDGMFVPKMAGMRSNEVGHRNYQHPERTGEHFSDDLDNFSAWAIYISLACLALDPNLHAKLGVGDDCLLFRADDFRQPEFSYAFAMLESHRNPRIVKLARHLRYRCHQPVTPAEPLNAEIPEVEDLPPLSTVAPTPAAGQLARPGLIGLPDWINLTEQEQSNLPEWMQNQIVTRRVWQSTAPATTVYPQYVQGAQVAPPAVRRFVTFDTAPSGSAPGYEGDQRLSPEFLQFLMLFNPAVWGMFMVCTNINFLFLSILCLWITMACQRRIWREATERKRLAQHGCKSKTTFFSVVSGISGMGTNEYTVKYKFRDYTGNEVTLEKPISATQAIGIGHLKEDFVYYDAAQPENAVLQSMLMYKVVGEWQIPPGVEPTLLPGAPLHTLPKKVPTRAVVRSVSDTYSRGIYYQYPTHRGIMNGERHFEITHILHLKPGDEFTVLYDEAQPQSHTWYGH